MKNSRQAGTPACSVLPNSILSRKKWPALVICSYVGENAHVEHANEQRKEVRDTLLAQGRILESGQGRGMRHTVPVVEKTSKKGKKA